MQDSIDMLIEMLMEVVRAEKSQTLLDATTCAAECGRYLMLGSMGGGLQEIVISWES